VTGSGSSSEPGPVAPPPPPDDEPVLPETTRDEQDVGWGDRDGSEDPDDLERFLRERPPHHD
jgi:hypothetical protein